ncbi:hypothetical protein G6M17_19550 [Agrobacterium tumefaciens]|nr:MULTISPECIES: hypothetical protein [Rhizobium/Agrobacterium group]MCZ7445668.1 hypothetical protein [Rhizobium rhizogenes]NSZ81367.1 hypothetical protein [Agrobacterium tumefaciens]
MQQFIAPNWKADPAKPGYPDSIFILELASVGFSFGLTAQICFTAA